MSILVRTDGIDRHGFTRHWHDVHGPLVGKLPDVMRYTQNHVVDLVPDPAGRHGYDIDGFVELYFADDAARQRAFAGPLAEPIWRDEPNFLGHSTAYVINGSREPAALLRDNKLIVVVEGTPSVIDGLEGSVRTLPAADAFERNDVTEVVPRATMTRGPQPVSAFFHVWFSRVEEARTAAETLASALRGADLERFAIARVSERRIV